MSVAVSDWLDLLAAPGASGRLAMAGHALEGGGGRYPVSATGIPLFGQSGLTRQAQAQRDHYDRIAADYVANLGYPHTQEYMAYLDEVLLKAIGPDNLGTVAELCCGHGEALGLKGLRFDRYIGIDVSEQMLEAGRAASGGPNTLFVQGDATKAPIADHCVDTVLMLGGIHHVPDRAALFREVRRILKPGGRFIFREPVSDLFVWKALRWVVYRVSPMLDAQTERPLEYGETAPVLKDVGLELQSYRTHGLFGFCVFMNSDVLVFNRLFRFVPGIRRLTRLSARIDEALLRLPLMGRAGLQVVGVARAPVAP